MYTLLSTSVVVLFALLNVLLPVVAAIFVFRRRQGYIVRYRSASGAILRPVTPLRFYTFGMYMELMSLPLVVIVVAKFHFRMLPAWAIALFCVCLFAGTALFTQNYFQELRHGVPTRRSPHGADGSG